MSTPYGYKIQLGKAVIDKPAAEQIKALFRNYLTGMSMKSAARSAGIMAYHGTIKRLLQNRHYIGDDFYPAIIDEATFLSAEQERVKRAEKLGRVKQSSHTVNDNKIQNHSMADHRGFTLKAVETKYDDPMRQAEYMYSLIVAV